MKIKSPVNNLDSDINLDSTNNIFDNFVKNMSSNKITKLNIFLFLFLTINLMIFTIPTPMKICDYWWHLKAGEYIVTNKSIPFYDVFSWYAVENNLYWFSHEWLSEVVLYLFSTIFGEQLGGHIFALLFLCATACLVFLFNRKKYFKNIIFSILWILLSLIVFPITTSPRPHMISFLLLTITMYILEDTRENNNSKKILFLPLISFLWANFHGGSSNLPYVLALIVLITGLFDFEFKTIKSKKLPKKQIKLISISIVLSVIALIINPHGISMITYPYSNMMDSLMLSSIQEWSAPDLKDIGNIGVYLCMFFILCVLLLKDKEDKFDLTDLTLILAFVYLTLKSTRFITLLYIVASFIIFKYFKEKHNHKHILLTLLSFNLAFSSFIFIHIEKYMIANNNFLEISISDEIIEVIKEENPQRLYNDYNLGSYLLYNDIKVFIDGRADLYSKYNFEDVVNFEKVKINMEEIIEKYNFDLFAVCKYNAIFNYLDSYSGVELIAEDENVAVFKPIK